MIESVVLVVENIEKIGDSMKWLKHMTNHQDEPSISALVGRLGWESYGWYWAIMEKIAASIGKDDRCSLEFPTEKWKKILGISSKKLRNFLEISTEFGIFTVKFSNNSQEFCEIGSPNLLIWRDEYSKKSGHSTDKLPTNSRQTPDQEVDIEVDVDVEGEQKKDGDGQRQPSLLEDPPKPEPKKRAKKQLEPVTELPIWLSQETWELWKQYRREIKKPMTPLAERMTIDRLQVALDNGWNPEELIQQACTASWQGCVFDKHLKTKYEPQQNGISYGQERRGTGPQASIQSIEQFKRATDPAFENGKIEPEAFITGEYERIA